MSSKSATFAIDLTEGSVRRSLLLFSLPFILGNFLQQAYNLADTWIVGRFLGLEALAAVGTSFALMVFLTSILIGLCMGAQVKLSHLLGAGEEEDFRICIGQALAWMTLLTALLTLISFSGIDLFLHILRIDDAIYALTKTYLLAIFAGLPAVYFYNLFAAISRARGNSALPIAAMVVSTLLNIGLDLLFILSFHWGVAGAAWATVLSQYISALLLLVGIRHELLALRPLHFRLHRSLLFQLLHLSLLASLQQSIMNFGILMIQSLVNSFGFRVTAAFAAGVKIDALAYMPVQDYGNAFSVYVAKNYGAQKYKRLLQGYREAMGAAFLFGSFISLPVYLFAPQLIRVFLEENAASAEIVAIGAHYLRIEGVFYFAIGWLFIYYGLFRGLGDVLKSILLTIVSLGSRVAIAYLWAPYAMEGIWWSIPIGWFLADVLGLIYWLRWKKRNVPSKIEGR